MQSATSTILLGLLLVASSALANQAQPENSPQPAYYPDVVPVSSAQQQHQAQVQAQQQAQNSPVVQVVGGQPQSSVVVNEGPQPIVHVIEHHHQPAQQVAGPQQQVGVSGASYYSPAGMIQVVGAGGEQVVGGQKPAVVRNYAASEQYGQPESASIPANYKPFGSWGLYIGGNPADGYYTNYYKALGSSVEKQQQGASVEQVKPVVGGPNQVSAFSPILKQASSSPYLGADYYPFAYSPAELNSGYPMVPVSSVAQHHQQQQQAQQAAGAVVPQAYSAASGVVVPAGESSLSYADSYATKKLGPSSVQAPIQVAQQQPMSKGYNSQKVSYYAYQAAPGAPAVASPQPQLVAYPVPVGSQIVGSQQGVDGAFAPYGVHAFTRYAVKPTVVGAAESGYYYSYPAGAHYSSYKQLGASTPVAHQQQQQSYHYNGQQVAYSPLGGSYYGYPMAQLHYSAGGVQQANSVVGESQVVGPQVVAGVHGHPGSVVSSVVHSAGQVEASASEKSETQGESVVGGNSVNKQQQQQHHHQPTQQGQQQHKRA